MIEGSSVKFDRCKARKVMWFPQCGFCHNNPNARRVVEGMFRGVCTDFKELK